MENTENINEVKIKQLEQRVAAIEQAVIKMSNLMGDLSAIVVKDKKIKLNMSLDEAENMLLAAFEFKED